MRPPLARSQRSKQLWSFTIIAVLGLGAGAFFMSGRPASAPLPIVGGAAEDGPGSGGEGARASHRATSRGVPRLRRGGPGSEVPEPIAARRLLSMGINEAFNAEERHPVWAPKMEKAMHTRIDGITQHPDVTTEVECRTSACRITLVYAPAVWKKYLPQGDVQSDTLFDTLRGMESGPMAKFSTVLVGRKPDGMIQEDALFIFDENNIDPDTYLAWVDAQVRLQAARRKERVAAQ